MLRVRALVGAVLAVVAGCGAEPRLDGIDEVAPAASPRAPAAARSPAKAAAPDAAVAITTAPKLAPYLWLLVVDLDLVEAFATYPGVPATTSFVTTRFEWPMPYRRGRYDGYLTAAAAHATGDAPIDRAVRAYTDVATRRVPELRALHDHYTTLAFLDDEFEHARHAAPALVEGGRELAAVRAALWSTVIEAWLAPYRDEPDHPRAIVSRAWASCLRAAEAVVTRAPAPAVARAISACRRASPTVPGVLPPALREQLVADLRSAAMWTGNVGSTSQWREYGLGSAIERLAVTYPQLWSQLPATSAEQAPR